MIGNTCYVLDTAVSIIHAGNYLEYLWWGAGFSFSSANAELDILDSGCPNAGKQMSLCFVVVVISLCPGSTAGAQLGREV